MINAGAAHTHSSTVKAGRNKLRWWWLSTSAKWLVQLDTGWEGAGWLGRIAQLRPGRGPSDEAVRPTPVHAPARTRRTPLGSCGACSGACGWTALRRSEMCAGSRGSATGAAAAPAGGGSGAVGTGAGTVSQASSRESAGQGGRQCAESVCVCMCMWGIGRQSVIRKSQSQITHLNARIVPCPGAAQQECSAVQVHAAGCAAAHRCACMQCSNGRQAGRRACLTSV